ncbi:MAG TPA: phosphatase PAP2 family protein [Polyangiales bacterium]|nr:phosphatase PAP2 family protein [Polyangiales bacterium]
MCLVLFASTRAQASDTPYRLYPALDAATMGASAAVWWVPSLWPGSFVAAVGCECRASSLNPLDRPVAGRWDTGYSITGELLIASAYVATVLLDLLDVVKADEPFSSFLVDLVVMAEAVLVNGALNQVAKIAIARPRPLLYERALDHPRQSDPDSYQSFYSAHTSSAFALGMAYAQTFAYRHPDSPYRFLAYAGAVLAGGVIGATRIAAGKHFPSDVLVGAAAGTAIGLVVPWLHRKSEEVQLSFSATPSGFGVSLTIHQL